MILHCKNAEMTMIKNNKNCMILHCKNAEMTISLSFLHFYSVKSYNFCYFFSPIQCFRLNKKNFFSNFYFFPSSDLNILKKKSVNQVLKKKGLMKKRDLSAMKKRDFSFFVKYIQNLCMFTCFEPILEQITILNPI